VTSKWKYWGTKTNAVYESFVQLRSDKKAAQKAFWVWYKEQKAQAWQEGYDAALSTDNPYLEGENK
jgi:hypothetical protein